ncbi:hypothetical protein C8R43DRAFT_951685 [Mycena crocata]|nr:hypothetical protein C8R43DRAFT_951685 [Mycena crocata]
MALESQLEEIKGSSLWEHRGDQVWPRENAVDERVYLRLGGSTEGAADVGTTSEWHCPPQFCNDFPRRRRVDGLLRKNGVSCWAYNPKDLINGRRRAAVACSGLAKPSQQNYLWSSEILAEISGKRLGKGHKVRSSSRTNSTEPPTTSGKSVVDKTLFLVTSSPSRDVHVGKNDWQRKAVYLPSQHLRTDQNSINRNEFRASHPTVHIILDPPVRATEEAGLRASDDNSEVTYRVLTSTGGLMRNRLDTKPGTGQLHQRDQIKLRRSVQTSQPRSISELPLTRDFNP